METQVLQADASVRSDNTLSFQTRFGDVELRKDRLIDFSDGILGFHHCKTFGLARLPIADESPILLLQCVEEPSVAFMVADPSILNLEIKAEDRLQALEATGMKAEDTQFLVILTSYPADRPEYLTANLRAPLLIDSVHRTGCQCVLANKEYTIQHRI